MSRHFCLLAPLLLAATDVSLVHADDPPAPTFANVTVHDPSIMKAADGLYYVYGSHLASARSPDLVNWTQISTDPVAGNPLQPDPQNEFATVLTWAETTTFWAPDTIQLGDGRYYHYYCACRGDSPLSAMGLAVSDEPDGPYEHVEVLLYSGMTGASEDGTTYNAGIHPNVVDPTLFFDEDENLWMVYGSYSGGIYIMAMNRETGLPVPDQGYGTKLIGRNHSRIEAPYILYSPESDYYYLFLSYGGLAADGGYNIRMARSRTPDGPYLDTEGNDLTPVGGANGTFFDDDAIAPYGAKLMGNYQFLTESGESGTSRGYRSPGHNSAYYDADTGRYYMVFHTRFVGRGEQHEVRVHQMWLNDEDWFVVGPHRFARETISPTDAGQVVGDYKLINHGKDITASVKQSTRISLSASGAISGDSTGTWSLSGDNYATLTVDGTTYRGVFARQWDDDRSRWLNTFSALSGEGVAIWGSRVAVDVSPAFLSSPASSSAYVGGDVTLSATASGEPMPAFQWRKDGVNISGATGRTLTLQNLSVADSAVYSVVATNAAGSATSAAATLSVAAPPSAITAHPVSLTQPAGTPATLSITVDGDGPFTYQWMKNGVVLAGETAAILSIASLTGGDAGDYTVQVTDAAGTTTSRLARVTVDTLIPGRLANASIRSVAGRGGSPLIIGMVMDGGSKDVLLRAVGPTLNTEYGVQGVLSDPIMTLYSGETEIASNDNWGSGDSSALSDLFQSLGAFPLPDSASADAALRTGVAGPITVHVNDAAGAASGVVIVECYDAIGTTSPRLLNVSARNHAGSGDETLIAGFVIDGNEPKRVLIRGVGPTLQSSFGLTGVLADPRLEVYTRINNIDTVIAANDDWGNENGVATASQSAGAFPLAVDSADAALVLTLPAGAYTAHVSGADGGTGEAIVEVYELP
jgi:arabinan endo-1,5-alpha-L-arabinosidase